MAAVSIDADFDCSLQQLWDFVSHVPNQDQWVFGMSDSEVRGGGPVQAGAVIEGTSTERGTALRVTMHVRDFEPPHRISWDNSDGHTPFLTEIECAGDDSRCRIRYRVTLYPTARLMKLMMGPLRPLGAVVANRMLRQEIDHLRSKLEPAPAH